MAWEVVFFTLQEGKDSPVETFIGDFDRKTMARISKSIDLLKKNGPFLKPPYIKKIRGQLYELRIKNALNIRIFYSFQQGKYVLLHGFKKKTSKTPAKEIKLALDRLNTLT